MNLALASLLLVSGMAAAEEPVALPPSEPSAPAPLAEPASPAPSSPEAPATAPTDAPAASSPAPSGGSGPVFRSGLSFGTVTMDGQTWTRLSFQPEVAFGKLGVVFDLELFLDGSQNLSSRGWDFDNPRNTTESVLRKIHHVRWDHPGAPLYARAGTLEGIDLGHGLVASNYGNASLYPDHKLLGGHVQINDFGAFGADVEAVVGSVQDFAHGGPVWALRAGADPLATTKLPFLSRLSVSAGIMRDQNQYAGLRDRDDDGCPDAIDFDASRASVCVPRPSPEQVYDASMFASLSRGEYAHIEDSLQNRAIDSVSATYGARKPFTMIWLQADQPILDSGLVSLSAYTAWAKPLAGEEDHVVDASGWGWIPAGAAATVGPVRLGAEYRVFQGPFQPGWFNATYDIERARFLGGRAITKEQFVYDKHTAERTLLQGYFARAGWNAFNIVDASGWYSHLFASQTGAHDQRSLGGRLALGSVVTGLLRKISLAEVYWQKERVGLDATDPQGRDGFFDNSIYVVHGVRVGSNLSEGLTLVVDRATTYLRQDDGTLQAMPQMRIETVLTF